MPTTTFRPSQRALSALLAGFFALIGGASAVWAQRGLDDPRVRAALDALNQEPPIQAVQRAALQFYRIDPSRVDALRTRAAFKALVPEVDVTYRRNDSNYDIAKTNVLIDDTAATQVDRAEGQVNELRVSGSWDLSRLVFNPEVLDVTSVSVLQEGVVKEVTRLYYARRRLQIYLILSPSDDPATQLTRELRVEELTATLDAMTGNMFSRAARTQEFEPIEVR